MQKSSDNEIINLIDQVRFRAVGDEGVLIHLESGRVIVVNEVGLHIVQQLKEARTREELAMSIALKFEVPAKRAESDLAEFLAELDRENVIYRTG